MSFTQGRGITPPEQEDEPRTIDDPELLALLEGNRQRGRIIRAELIQAAIDEQNALYQPPPDIRTPDRQPSPPVGGLPSPDSSPPPGYYQLLLTHPPHTTTPSLPLSNQTVSTPQSSTLPLAHSASAATPGMMFSSPTSSTPRVTTAPPGYHQLLLSHPPHTTTPSLPLSNQTVSTPQSSTLPLAHSASAATPGKMFSSPTSSAPRVTTPPPAQSPPAATPDLVGSSLTNSVPRSSAFHSNSSRSGTWACWSLRKPRPSQGSCHGACFHDCPRLSSAVNAQSTYPPSKTRTAPPQAKQPKQPKTADSSRSHAKHRKRTTCRARVSPPSAMTTRSQVTPHTTFRELGETLQRRQTTATKPGSSRKANNVLHVTPSSSSSQKLFPKLSSYSGVQKRRIRR